MAFDRHLKWLVPQGHRSTLSFAGDALDFDITPVAATTDAGEGQGGSTCV